MTSWPPPSSGDLVWCHFPFLPDTSPGPKPRPVLVVGVRRQEDGATVTVAYGTTKRTTALRAGEFLISEIKHPTAFKQAGLAFDTKFDLNQLVELPWSDRYFKVPPMPSTHGQHPKIGSLHASMSRALLAAYNAAKKP